MQKIKKKEKKEKKKKKDKEAITIHFTKVPGQKLHVSALAGRAEKS